MVALMVAARFDSWQGTQITRQKERTVTMSRFTVDVSVTRKPHKRWSVTTTDSLTGQVWKEDSRSLTALLENARQSMLHAERKPVKVSQES